TGKRGPMGHPASGTRDATQGLSDGAGTDEEEKRVGCRSHCHHRCGDGYGHAAVKSGWRDMRGRYTEEQGRLLGNGRCPESGDKKTTAIPKDRPPVAQGQKLAVETKAVNDLCIN